jgi:protein SCO1
MRRDGTAVNRERTSRCITSILCVLFAVAAFAGLDRWTRGGSAWTYDELRLLDAQAGIVRAPAVRLLDDLTPLWEQREGARQAYLVDFIYTRCISVCQALGSEYQRMQSALAADPARVRLVSLSIDPAGDSPQALAAWARRQHAEPLWWTVGRARTPGKGQDLLRALGVVVVPDGTGGFVHNGAIHLIDAQGRLRALFDYTRWPDALAAARQIATELP